MPTPATAEGRYANCFAVGYNELEFVLEFGQQYNGPAGFHTRVVMSPANVEPLIELLQQSLDAQHSAYPVAGAVGPRRSHGR